MFVKHTGLVTHSGSTRAGMTPSRIFSIFACFDDMSQINILPSEPHDVCKMWSSAKVIAVGFVKLTRYMLVGSHVTRLTPLEWPSSFSTIVLSSASITLMNNSLLSISTSEQETTR